MRLARWCVGVMLAGLMPWAWPADEAERETLKRERQAIESEHDRRAEECRHQFVVTPCLDKVRTDRQKALRNVLERESALDAQERRERAQARKERLGGKSARAAAASAVASAPRVPKVPAPTRRDDRSARPMPPTSRTASGPSAATPDRRAREQQKRAEFEARQREIEAHRVEVEKRNAERARSKSAQPLPVPASAGR